MNMEKNKFKVAGNDEYGKNKFKVAGNDEYG